MFAVAWVGALPGGAAAGDGAAAGEAAEPAAESEGARERFEDGLVRAAGDLNAGNFRRAAERAGTLAEIAGPARRPGEEGQREAASPIARADRAEAWRIFGLALFFQDRLERAEAALLEYMKLEREAHLDPGLVPPEAIVFFEDVRSRHRARIQAYHPEPEDRRWRLLSLVPPAGQFQNGDRAKGWMIAASGAALIAVNVGSYAALRRWCDGDDGLCGAGGARYGQARALRAVNMASIVALGGLYTYGVIDGFAGFGGDSGRASISIGPAGLPGVALSGRF